MAAGLRGRPLGASLAAGATAASTFSAAFLPGAMVKVTRELGRRYRAATSRTCAAVTAR